MAEAVIIHGVGGHYTLHRHEPAFEGLAYLRGILRQDEIRPLVGDRVVYQASHDPDIPFVVNEILPRRNVSVRPAIANLDLLIITVSIAKPRPDYLLLDRLIVYCRANDIVPVLLITKMDLVSTKNKADAYDELIANYARADVKIFSHGFDDDDTDLQGLMEYIRGRSVAFAGQSGVGKSTKLNDLLGQSMSLTGAVSTKIGRGRHTTRETTLFPLDHAGYMADTPGFSVLNLGDLGLTGHDLRAGYAEFDELTGVCRFLDCNHDGDMGCAVHANMIHPRRLDRYRKLLLETVSSKRD